MISKYQTIPHEEETLSAAPKKQNDGRKVAGALLAFALAAGLAAAAAGRNRVATLQENTSCAVVTPAMNTQWPWEGEITCADDGSAEIVCKECRGAWAGDVATVDVREGLTLECST